MHWLFPGLEVIISYINSLLKSNKKKNQILIKAVNMNKTC